MDKRHFALLGLVIASAPPHGSVSPSSRCTHPAGRGWTVGCISIDNDDDAKRVLAMIKGSTNDVVDVRLKPMFGFIPRSGTESVARLGRLTVYGSPEPERSP